MLECIAAYEKESGRNIKDILADGRDGDSSKSYAYADKIKKFCNWAPGHDLGAMGKDRWNW